MGSRPILLVVTSDQHAGSTVAVCPPEGVRKDDGGRYLPSKSQLFLWEKWEDFHDTAAKFARQEKADTCVVLNGDLTEGDHHDTHQIISRATEAQNYVAERVFSVPMKTLKPKKLYVVRGTTVHVGAGGATEESLAQKFGAEKDLKHETWSHWHLRLNFHGVQLDFQHHTNIGSQPWTKQNVVNSRAAKIFYEHAARRLRHPDLAFRSHVHQYADSGDAHPTRLIVTPSWQLKTAHAHKVATDNIADIGGVMTMIYPNGEYEVRKRLYLPALPEAMEWK